MKFTRTAKANWKGSGMEGKGLVSTQSTTLNDTQYSFKSRFEEGVGTNPEELIGAAHSGCFTMKLSFVLTDAGYVPENLDTTAKVTFEDGLITLIQLELNAKVPNISNEEFQALAINAKENCPISKLLNAEISLVANLV
ncbi:OsmC family protein [Flavobacterium urocaniciphilum]|uniref:Osmotically inducible protein OsmC n=1 Tax=Flavobacterium urocaniciphilum TaxID=1299341 RepID=A0A1H9AIZ4_9FLAO|nr:OsmC family protein [Flavobacterium urocaniciphilum]SEP76714.1 osmotically inducible protein OsmC [Flavobacterium urocaniciphilum]